MHVILIFGDAYLLHGGDKENGQCDEMKQRDKHQKGRHGDKQHLSTYETFSSVHFCVENISLLTHLKYGLYILNIYKILANI